MFEELEQISEETRRWLAEDIGVMELRRWGARTIIAVAQLIDNLDKETLG